MQMLIQLDHVFQQLVAQFRNPFFDMLAIFCDWIGSDVRVYGLFLLFFFIPKKTRRFALLALVSVALATAIVAYVKVIADRPRPFVVQHIIPIIDVDTSEYFVSFPSGHTVAIASVVSAYYFYFKRHLFIGACLVVVMAWSRMYLNMHYPSDTLVGALIGVFISWSLVSIVKYYQNRKLERKGVK